MSNRYSKIRSEESAWETLGSLIFLVVMFHPTRDADKGIKQDVSKILDQIDRLAETLFARQKFEIHRAEIPYVHSQITAMFRTIKRNNIGKQKVEKYIKESLQPSFVRFLSTDSPFLESRYLNRLVFSREEIKAQGGPAMTADLWIMKLFNLKRRQVENIRRPQKHQVTYILDDKLEPRGQFSRSSKSTPYVLESILRKVFCFTDHEIKEVLKLAKMIHYPLNPMSESQIRREVSGRGKMKATVISFKNLEK